MTKTEQRKVAIKAQINLRKLTQRCDDLCAGWFIATQPDGYEIQVCDECQRSLPKAERITDYEVACMPAAVKALLYEAKRAVYEYNRAYPELAEPLNLSHELTQWQRSLGIPGLPGLTGEEQEDLADELGQARAYMDEHHPAGVH